MRATLLASGIWLVQVAGCNVSLEAPADVVITCSGSADCPGGEVCNTPSGWCVAKGLEDSEPPRLLAPAVITPAVARAGAAVTIRIRASEPLHSPPAVTFGIGSSTVVLEPSSIEDGQQPIYHYQYTVTGQEAEGTVTPTVDLTDKAGNHANVPLVSSLTFDFTAPDVVVGSEHLLLVPSHDNRQRNPTLATVGTTIRVDFTATEDLGADPELVFENLPALGFPVTHHVENTWTFTLTLATAVPADGPQVLTAHVVDLAGNQKDVPLDLTSDSFAQGLVVKTTPPAAPDVVTDQMIVLHRAPWGALATAGQTQMWLTGAPGAVEAGTTVLAFAHEAAVLELARADSEPDGGFGNSTPMAVDGVDLPVVWLLALDGAGNESGAPVSVADIELRVSMGDKVAYDDRSNPNHFQTRAWFDQALYQARNYQAGAGDGIAALDQQGVTTTGLGTWRHVGLTALNLPILRWEGLVYDVARNRMVLFGGQTALGFTNTGIVFEKGVGTWNAVPTLDPEQDGSPSTSALLNTVAVFDASREQLLAFMPGAGGLDTWTWTGESWRRLCTSTACLASAPANRTNAGVAYDPARRVTVLFGGRLFTGSYTSETWEFDGKLWQQVCTTSPCADTMPSPRYQHAQSFDGTTGEVAVFGGATSSSTPSVGSDELWTWNGQRWLQRCTDATCSALRPSGRKGAAIAYNPLRQQLVMLSGAPVGGACDVFAPAETWLWSGQAWTVDTSSPQPDLRDGSMMAYDPSNGTLLQYGGNDTTDACPVIDGASVGSNTSWTWNGTRWTAMPTAPSPPPDSGPVLMAFDYNAARRFVTATTISAATTYTTRGMTRDAWALRTTSGTPAASSGSPVLASEGFSRTKFSTAFGLMLFGVGASSNDTWTLRADTWACRCGAAPCPALCPLAARDGATVTNLSGVSTLLFGGGDYPKLDDTWIWNSSAWTQYCTSAAPCQATPPGRSDSALAYHTSLGYALMFSGAVTPCGGNPADTWTWNGTTWTQLFPAHSPIDRIMHRMAYDASRDKTFLFGGVDFQGCIVQNHDGYGDFWEWDGTDWRQLQAADPDGDGDPVARWSHAMTYDAANGTIVVQGGTRSAYEPAGTWIWNGGAAARPAHVLDVVLSAAGALPGDTPTSVDVDWYGAGVGYPGATATQGYGLSGWDSLYWAPLLAEPDANDATHLHWSTLTAADWVGADPSRLARLFVGPDRHLFVAAAPAAPNGSASTMGSITTDYAEVTVRYRRN